MELKVSLTLMERERDNIEWDQKFSRIVPIERCEHEEECKFLNQHEIICGGTPSLPHSTPESSSPTVVHIHGNVDTLGNIGGQNIQNTMKSKDRPKQEVAGLSIMSLVVIVIASQFNSVITSSVIVIAVLLYTRE